MNRYPGNAGFNTRQVAPGRSLVISLALPRGASRRGDRRG
jgi:hypothetical protein